MHHLQRASKRHTAVDAALIGALLVALVVAGLVTAMSTPRSAESGAARTTSPLASQWVTRAGTQLRLGGKPFRFVGFNFYEAAASAAYQCAPWTRYSAAELDAAMGQMHDQAGATVLRFWAYQTYTQGGTDFSPVDRVIAAARRHGMRVIPVLEDGPDNCTTGKRGLAKSVVEGGTWYLSGYRQPFGTATLSYRDYVARVVSHYRDDPTILGWMMMNEAETRSRDDMGRSAVVDFATDIGSLIKSIDPRHLVTVGTQGNGAPGVSGTDFLSIYQLPTIDFAEVHDWASYGSDTTALPGSADGHTLPAVTSPGCDGMTGRIACSFSYALTVLHKPIIIGEAGIAADDTPSRARRSDLLTAKMHAAFAAGASGYLVWQWNHVLDSEHYDVLPDTGDPLLPAMRRTASALTSP